MKFKPGDRVELVDRDGSTGKILMGYNPEGYFIIEKILNRSNISDNFLKLKGIKEIAFARRFIAAPNMNFSEQDLEEIHQGQEIYTNLVDATDR